MIFILLDNPMGIRDVIQKKTSQDDWIDEINEVIHMIILNEYVTNAEEHTCYVMSVKIVSF